MKVKVKVKVKVRVGVRVGVRAAALLAALRVAPRHHEPRQGIGHGGPGIHAVLDVAVRNPAAVLVAGAG